MSGMHAAADPEHGQHVPLAGDEGAASYPGNGDAAAAFLARMWGACQSLTACEWLASR
jgi:hypothetical protein